MSNSPRNQAPIPTEIAPSATRADMSADQVTREFHDLLARGAVLEAAGSVNHDPRQLLARGYTPKHRIDLFDTRFYLANARQNPELRFFPAYVVKDAKRGSDAAAKGRRWDGTRIYPRLFYKDISLVWRSASHYSDADGLWIGKGDTYLRSENGYEIEESLESTTDLPLEIQPALDDTLSRARQIRRDDEVIGMILRRAPANRIRPFADFTRPRREAAALAANLINRGRRVARFTRRNDPTSLVFVAGFEPDFEGGVLETTDSRSRLYGGALRRFRILSKNQRIQYWFFAGPTQVWIIPPQATTTELSSYGVRTIDVLADDDLFIPAFEYHYVEDGVLYSQIPRGFAGDLCAHDDAKADASPWLDRVPVIREFRRKVLGGA